MTKAKAKRFAVRLEIMVASKSESLRNCFGEAYSLALLRAERDFLAEVAVELRLLSEGKRLPKKVTR